MLGAVKNLLGRLNALLGFKNEQELVRTHLDDACAIPHDDALQLGGRRCSLFVANFRQRLQRCTVPRESNLGRSARYAFGVINVEIWARWGRDGLMLSGSIISQSLLASASASPIGIPAWMYWFFAW